MYTEHQESGHLRAEAVPVTSWMTGDTRMDESRSASISMGRRAEKIGVPVTQLGHSGGRATAAPELCLGHAGLKLPQGHSS